MKMPHCWKSHVAAHLSNHLIIKGKYPEIFCYHCIPLQADDASAMASKLDENCVICMDRVNKPKKLKCGHIFCTDCIDSYFSSCKKVCPTCGVVCGIVKGDQPKGTMDIKHEKYLDCAGFERAGSFVITYSFPSGIQGVSRI